MRVLIVCEHASNVFGGEAILPWHYFSFLRLRGVDVHLVSHARSRPELLHHFSEASDRLHFVEDAPFDRMVAWIAARIPSRMSQITVGFAGRLRGQLHARRLARKLIKEFDIQVVHQPTPVSPRDPSLLHGLGVPVIFGPMNGNMDYPSAFAYEAGSLQTGAIHVMRRVSALLHLLIPGKRKAAILLYANDRTRDALPKSNALALKLVENGVDFRVFKPSSQASAETKKFVFVGRLVDWKKVDILIEALAQSAGIELLIIGDGPERRALEILAHGLEVTERVSFVGWKPQDECSALLSNSMGLVLPSVLECGGAVVLEAMACGVPVVATNWGGPADYLDQTSGILIEPLSRDHMVREFARVMNLLAVDAALRYRLGAGGLLRVKTNFSWEHKIERILGIYAVALKSGAKR